MSLINKMLQELDKRHAPQAVQATTHPLAANVRPVKAARVGSELFWWVVAAALLLAIAWLGWVMWQLSPRPVVNELALRVPVKVAEAAQADSAPAGFAEADADPSALNEAQAPLTSVDAGLFSGRPDMLKLATEITTPIPRRVARPIAPVKPASEPVPAKPPVSAASRPALPAPSAVARPASSAVAQPEARIDRRMTSTDRDRAEAEYRRGVSLVNQGRMSEGMEALTVALGIDGGFEPARQTLVSLLIEQGRTAEAAVVLQEYQVALRLSPQSGVWWLGLGISQEASGQPKEAAEAFRRARSSGSLNPDLLAFVDQRLRQLQ
jgi:MSHA biogenesis protein MshN